MNQRCRLWAAPFAGLLCLASGAAWASGLQVSPMLLTIKTPLVAEGLWLSNTGTKELHAQVRVFRWTQAGLEGKQLAPSRELVISPPIVDLQPGQKQLVRVIRTGQPPVGKHASERAYRLIINELPRPKSERHKGINFILRYSLPVFVEPAGTAKPPASALHWTLRLNGGQAVLRATNDGAKHARLTDVVFIAAGGARTVLKNGLFGYVLAHATRDWNLKPGAKVFAQGGSIQAQVNGKTVTQPVTLGTAPR